jgi:hypothetical protein
MSVHGCGAAACPMPSAAPAPGLPGPSCTRLGADGRPHLRVCTSRKMNPSWPMPDQTTMNWEVLAPAGTTAMAAPRRQAGAAPWGGTGKARTTRAITPITPSSIVAVNQVVACCRKLSRRPRLAGAAASCVRSILPREPCRLSKLRAGEGGGEPCSSPSAAVTSSFSASSASNKPRLQQTIMAAAVGGTLSAAVAEADPQHCWHSQAPPWPSYSPHPACWQWFGALTAGIPLDRSPPFRSAAGWLSPPA